MNIEKIYIGYSLDYDNNGNPILGTKRIDTINFIYPGNTYLQEKYNPEIHEKSIIAFLRNMALDGKVSSDVSDLIEATSDENMGVVIKRLVETKSDAITFCNPSALEEKLSAMKAIDKYAFTKAKAKPKLPVAERPVFNLTPIPNITIKTTPAPIERIAAAPEKAEGFKELPEIEEPKENPVPAAKTGADDDKNERDPKQKRKGLWAAIGAAVAVVGGLATAGVTNFMGFGDNIANWWYDRTKSNNEKVTGPSYLTDYEKSTSDISKVKTKMELLQKTRPGIQRDTVEAAYNILQSIPNAIEIEGNFRLTIDGDRYLEFTPREVIDAIVVLNNYTPSQIAQVYNGSNFSSKDIYQGFNAFYEKVMTYYMNATEPLPLRAMFMDNEEAYEMFRSVEENIIALNVALKNDLYDSKDGTVEFPNDIKDKLLKQFIELMEKNPEYKAKNLEGAAILTAALSDSYILSNRNIKTAMVFSKDDSDCGAKKGDTFYQVARIKCQDTIPRDATFANEKEVSEKDRLVHDELQRTAGYYNSMMDKLDQRVLEAEKPEYAAVAELKASLRATGIDSLEAKADRLEDSNNDDSLLASLRKDPRTTDMMTRYDLAMNPDKEARGYARYDDVVEKLREIFDITTPEVEFDKNDVTSDLTVLQNNRFRSFDKELGGYGFYNGVHGHGVAPETGKKLVGTREETKTTEETNVVDGDDYTEDQRDDAEKPTEDQLAEDNAEADHIIDLNEQENDGMFVDSETDGLASYTDPNSGHEVPLTGDPYDALLHGANPDTVLEEYLDEVGYDNMTEEEQQWTEDHFDDLAEEAAEHADESAAEAEEAWEHANDLVDQLNAGTATPATGDTNHNDDSNTGTPDSGNNNNNGENNTPDNSGSTATDSDGDNDPNTGEQTYDDEEVVTPASKTIDKLNAVKQALNELDDENVQEEVVTESAPQLSK